MEGAEKCHHADGRSDQKLRKCVEEGSNKQLVLVGGLDFK